MNFDQNIPFLQKFALKKIVKPPLKCVQHEFTVISSKIDDVSTANSFLIDLSMRSIAKAQKADLSSLALRMAGRWKELTIWPGEHYRLLAGIALEMQPKVIVDIGTHYGQSALVFKYTLGNAIIHTFDIIPCEKYENAFLKPTDFSDSFSQHTDDLSQYSNIIKHQKLLESADLFFIDAAKDGSMEYKLLQNLEKINLKPNCILVFDDIHLWHMVRFWKKIKFPKLDLTSFGHWTGTGMVHWNPTESHA